MTNAELIQEIEDQRNLMVAVSTGGPQIKTVNSQYAERRHRIRLALRIRDIDDPNPHGDLWAWYGKYSSDLPSWASRRDFLGEMYQPLIDLLIDRSSGESGRIFEEPTGWTAIDRDLSRIREALAAAQTERDYQAIGLHCRDLLITLGQEVYDPTQHEAVDGTAPSETDAKRMIEAYISSELPGRSNAEVRRHAKASFDLANALQHRRTADFRTAAMCAESTAGVVNLIAIISGRRDP